MLFFSRAISITNGVTRAPPSTTKHHQSTAKNSAIDYEWFSHRAFHGEALDVVPILLQQRDKEVNGHERVLPQLVWCHVDVTNSHTHAEHLLELKLHLATNLLDLTLNVITGTQQSGKLASFVKTRAQETRDLWNEGLRCQKGIELLRELLDKLLVLVELLQVLNTLERDVGFLSLLTVRRVAEHADLHAGTGHMRKFDGTC